MEIPKNEIWFIDIKKYIYDTVSSYHPLLEKWLKKVILRTFENVSREERPFICINDLWGSTDSVWIRSVWINFEIYASSMEEGEILKDILIDLFNRRNVKWIRSRLETDIGWWMDKNWLTRHLLDFEFIFKDMKY